MSLNEDLDKPPGLAAEENSKRDNKWQRRKRRTEIREKMGPASEMSSAKGHWAPGSELRANCEEERVAGSLIEEFSIRRRRKLPPRTSSREWKHRGWTSSIWFLHQLVIVVMAECEQIALEAGQQARSENSINLGTHFEANGAKGTPYDKLGAEIGPHNPDEMDHHQIGEF